MDKKHSIAGKFGEHYILANWALKDIGKLKFGKFNKTLTKYHIWMWLSREPFQVLHDKR